MNELVKQGKILGCPYQIENVGDFFTGTVHAHIVGCGTEDEVIERIEKIVKIAHEDMDQW